MYTPQVIFLAIIATLMVIPVAITTPITHIAASPFLGQFDDSTTAINTATSMTTGNQTTAATSVQTSASPSNHIRSWHLGYVGSYASENCTGQPLPGDRPKLDAGFRAHCKPFKPMNGTVGIFWGEVSNESREVTFYADGDCQNLSLIGAFKRPYGPEDSLVQRSCIHLHDYVVDVEFPKGVQIGSIKDTGQ